MPTKRTEEDLDSLLEAFGKTSLEAGEPKENKCQTQTATRASNTSPGIQNLAAHIPVEKAALVTTLNSRRTPQSCWKIRYNAEKGHEMFAAEDIPKGKRIIAEKPLMKAQSFPASEEQLQAEFDKLSAKDKRAFQQLHSAHIPEDTTWLQSRFYTNSVTWNDGSATFILISRINHSCIPNASFSYNASLNMETVHAFKNIKKGEEITISYILPYATKEERNATLRARYGFSCKCEACEPTSQVWRNSATRRQQMVSTK